MDYVAIRCFLELANGGKKTSKFYWFYCLGGKWDPVNAG